MNQQIDNAIGGYEDCHLVNQPTLQDVFEQVCKALKQCHGEIWSVHSKYGDYENAKKHSYGLVLADSALEAAAPFRKTGA